MFMSEQHPGKLTKEEIADLLKSDKLTAEQKVAINVSGAKDPKAFLRHELVRTEEAMEKTKKEGLVMFGKNYGSAIDGDNLAYHQAVSKELAKYTPKDNPSADIPATPIEPPIQPEQK